MLCGYSKRPFMWPGLARTGMLRGRAAAYVLGALVGGFNPVNRNGVRATHTLQGHGVLPYPKIHSGDVRLIKGYVAPVKGACPKNRHIFVFHRHIHLMIGVVHPAHEDLEAPLPCHTGLCGSPVQLYRVQGYRYRIVYLHRMDQSGTRSKS